MNDMDDMCDIHVLHVDDDPEFAELTADFLEREDERLTVETTTSASEVLDRLAGDDVDCLISDYDMPGQNGIELLESVREARPDLPFILFTDKGSEAIASDAISAGVTDYLQKEPGTGQFAVLANRVRNAVEGYRARQARDRQRRAIETAHEGISILDRDGEFIYVNRSFADLYGYAPDEMLGESWELVYPDEEIQFVRDVVLSAVAEDGSWSGETTGLRADGTTFPETHTVTRTATGEFVCSVRDRSAERERRSKLLQFRTLVETLNDPVYVLDETGRFEYVNDAFVEMVGYDRETVLGATPALVKSDSAVERAEDRLGRLLSSDGPDNVQFEVEIRPGDGDPILCEDNMAVLPYDGEWFEGSVGILWDITERKERDRELRRQNERLDAFASLVSHDLRTPLGVAEGRLELARTECDSRHLAAIEDALDRMDALVEDVLTLARGVETDVRFEPVEFDAALEACWTNVETTDATLVADVGRTISADETRLKQVLENLVGNAVERGGANVTVTVGELDDGFYVEDDGPGIPEDERDEVFERGYSTSDEGTGLGLYIVARTVEACDWDVRVTDAPEGGARFEITGVEFAEE